MDQLVANGNLISARSSVPDPLSTFWLGLPLAGMFAVARVYGLARPVWRTAECVPRVGTDPTVIGRVAHNQSDKGNSAFSEKKLDIGERWRAALAE